ncbi:MAG: hypothetical protein AAF701_10255 [Pseudomonadota bacterium]
MTYRISASTWAIVAAQGSFLVGHAAVGLPVDDAAWDVVRAVDIQEIVTDTTYEVRKTFPTVVDGGIAQFQLTGFVRLTQSDKNVDEFILVSDMGYCPYCGDADHGAALQINLSSFEEEMFEGDRITVMGDLTPIYDRDTWQAYVLQNALVLR